MKKNLLFCLAVLLTTAVSAQDRPVIGVSCSWSPTEISVPTTYLDAVSRAGGLPVVIPLSNDPEILKQQVGRLDGLVLIGGGDFDPLLFGQEPMRALGKVTPERDAYDLALIRLAQAKGIPLLGICRGHQGINVANGGTLLQDIPSCYGKPSLKHQQSAGSVHGSHTVVLDRQSVLYGILQADSLVVNSFHHQAVDRPAPGFRVTARSADGIIEAIEKADGSPVIGVQWHPEALARGGDGRMLKLFRYLVDRASALKK